jgi:hypothetical protein
MSAGCKLLKGVGGMEWLIVSGVVSLLAGLFLLTGEALLKLGEWLYRPVAYIDDVISSISRPAGIFLVIVGGWIISVAFSYAELWYLHIVGALILFFGLLYLFLPDWLSGLSWVVDGLILSGDDLVLGVRRLVGIILLIISFYIFYATLLVR